MIGWWFNIGRPSRQLIMMREYILRFHQKQQAACTNLEPDTRFEICMGVVYFHMQAMFHYGVK